jgi:hypothetical protein
MSKTFYPKEIDQHSALNNSALRISHYNAMAYGFFFHFFYHADKKTPQLAPFAAAVIPDHLSTYLPLYTTGIRGSPM